MSPSPADSAGGDGGEMATNVLQRARTAMHELPNAPAQMAALDRMSVDELAEKFRELYGEPTRTRNKPYLRKRLMWRIQELSEGGLSLRARAKIDELSDEFPERWRMRQAASSGIPAPSVDSRLPAPGCTIEKTHDGTLHRVTVLEDGFEYQGEAFRSLSAIAKRITGTNWNGFTFFGLKATTRAAQPEGGHP